MYIEVCIKGVIIMHEGFIEQANIKRNDCLMKTEMLFVNNKNDWFVAFAEHFEAICGQIQKMQIDSKLSAISYLEYTMLYTNFVNRQYISEIWVYDRESYLDKNQHMIDNYDISFLFAHFDELWDELLALKRRYINKVSAKDVTNFMLQVLPDFYSYLANIARFAVAECVDKTPFIDIKKNMIFMVNVGDYMVKTETILTESKNKNANELAKWFYERLGNKYTFGDYSDLDFSAHCFTHNDFRYAQFRGSKLNYSSLSKSSLIGTNFRNAEMEKCCLDGCAIYEADFSNASLKNASFQNTYAKTGLINKKNWEFVGFLPVKFNNADLTGANFTNANLIGADFSNAVLTDANFTNAIVDNAIFSSYDVPLTDDQIRKIIIKDKKKE